MPRRRDDDDTPVDETNLTAENIKADRMSELAAKKKAALEALEEARQMEAELGLASGPEIEEIAPAPTPPPVSGDTRFEEVIGELRGQGRWEVYKLTGGREVKIGSYSLNEWPEQLDTCARQARGGDLKVVFKHPNGTYATSRTFSFSQEAYSDGGVVGTASTGAKEDFHRVLEMMERKEQAFRESEMALRKEMLQMQLEIAKTTASSNPFKSAADMKAMMEMFQRNPMEDLTSLLDVLARLKGEGAPLGEPPSPLQMAVNTAVELLKPLVEVGARKLAASIPAPSIGRQVPVNQGALPQPPGQVNSMAPAPTPASASEVPTINAPPTLNEIEKGPLVAYAGQLLQIIQSGLSPDTAASAVLDSLDDVKLAGLKPLIEDTALLTKLYAVNPALVQHQGWLADFIMILKEEITGAVIPSMNAGPVIEQTPIQGGVA